MSARPPPPKRQRLDSLKSPQPRTLPSLSRKKPGAQPYRAPSNRQCPNPACHSTDIGEEDGQTICRGCGTVVSESNIVSEVQFAETSGGGHSMMGQHVGSDQAHARGTLGALKNAGGMNPRDQAHSAGKLSIHQLGTALNIKQDLKDQAMMIFILAASNNFIQGRNTKHVAAVSIYIASRLKPDSHKLMLIDFSDILQISVFRLGQIYKDLIDEIRINGSSMRVKPIYPENLLYRFAERLEFGRDQEKVAMDGIRILQRMHRDWMSPGRRPAGVCGAALIIAARMHNYRRTVREMVFVAKVAEPTLMKRLEEFAKTESSGLTVEEFRRIDLERFQDPPAFHEQNSGTARQKRKRRVEEFDDDGDTDVESQRASSMPASTTAGQLQTSTSTQQRLGTDGHSMPPPPIPSQSALKPPHPSAKRKRGRPEKQRLPKVQGKPLASPAASTEVPIDPDITTAMSNPASLTHASALTQVLHADDALATPPPSQQASAKNTRAPVLDTEDISDSEFGPDTEIFECLLTPSEVQNKTRIWTHDNRDWLRAQYAKELRQKIAEENGTLPKIKRRVRRRTRMGDMASYHREKGQDGGSGLGITGDDAMPAGNAAESVKKMLMKRGYSTKINYSALSKLYGKGLNGSTNGSRRGSASAASEIAESPGAGDFFASPQPVVDINITAPSDISGGEEGEPGPTNTSDHEDNVGQVLPVDMDDIQAIAREEEEERRSLALRVEDPESLDKDIQEDDDNESEPGDYYGGSDDEDDSIEDILKKAAEKDDDDDHAGDDDEYDYD